MFEKQKEWCKEHKHALIAVGTTVGVSVAGAVIFNAVLKKKVIINPELVDKITGEISDNVLCIHGDERALDILEEGEGFITFWDYNYDNDLTLGQLGEYGKYLADHISHINSADPLSLDSKVQLLVNLNE